MKYHFLFSTDKNYYPYLLVLVQSLFDNLKSATFDKASDELHFHVLVDDSVNIDEANAIDAKFLERNEAQSFAKFNYYRMDKSIFQNATTFARNPGSLGAYYRLLAGDILPQDIDKVLYLDIDILIAGDIIEVFTKYDISNRLMGVVLDLGVYKTSSIKALKDAQKKILGDEYKLTTKDYFNSGVLYINLDLWRKHNISQHAVDIVTNYQCLIYDQDALNVLNQCDLVKNHPDFGGSLITIMDPRYNFQQIGYMLQYNKETDAYDDLRGGLKIFNMHLSAAEFEDAMKHTVVAHYNNSKPWAPTAVRETKGRCFVSHPYFDFYMDKWRVTAMETPETNLHVVNYSEGEVTAAHLEVLHKKVRKILKSSYLAIGIIIILFVLTWIALGLDIAFDW